MLTSAYGGDSIGVEKVKVLIVDDDEEDYALICDKLEDIEGGLVCELKWVATYEAAVETLTNDDYAVCLTDYNLRAQKTGLDLVQEMTRSGCHVPFIVLTGQGTLALCIEAGTRGAVDFLDKGALTSEKLGDSVRKALRAAQTTAKLRQADEQLRRLGEG